MVDFEDSTFAHHFLHFVAVVIVAVVEEAGTVECLVEAVVVAAAYSEVLEQSVLAKTSSFSSVQPNVEPPPYFDYSLAVLEQ